MRNLFASYGSTMRSLVVLADTAVERGVTVAPVPEQWQVAMSEPGQFVKTIPAAVWPALDEAKLLRLFGHGNPGTVCSLEVSAFRDVKMTDKIVIKDRLLTNSPA